MQNKMSPKKLLKIGIVGATGMVGQTFMKILDQRKIEFSELRPFASENSLGKSINVGNRDWKIQTLKAGCFEGLDLVFFSSGDDISKEWAPKAVASGAYAVDNSAAFRMDPNTHLVVPEVNGHLLDESKKPQVIANPNCSTIQLVVALKPLSDAFGIEDVKVSSYQAVSGAGQPAYDELLNQVVSTAQITSSKKIERPSDLNLKSNNFPHPIAFNVIPQIGSFNSEGFTSEEVKIMKETKKILNLPNLKVSAFTVRVPALNAHSESVWVRLKKQVTREEIIKQLSQFKGLIIQDDPASGKYPMPYYVAGEDPVYVGRIHRDPEDPHLWLMWIVSDNIRKGAALNGLQIAERIFDIH